MVAADMETVSALVSFLLGPGKHLGLGAAMEALRVRGGAVKSALDSVPASKLPCACRARLLKLVRGELNFVEKSGSGNSAFCSNLGHFEAVVQVLQHPLVSGICAVNQRFSTSASSISSSAHVDLVGLYDGKPAWLVVSDRNPKHISWTEGESNKGLRCKVALLLEAALANPVVRPACIIFYFARGVEAEIASNLEAEFNAYKVEADDPLQHRVSEVESGEWLLVEDETHEEFMNNSWISLPVRNKATAVMYRIDVATPALFEGEMINLNAASIGIRKSVGDGSDSMFYTILEDVNQRWGHLPLDRNRLVNLDTTALIGIVSGLSNNMAASIAGCSEKKLESKYYSFGHFFKTQALLELERPFLPEVAAIFKQKQPMISQFAWDEFDSIVSVVGGPDEKRRASALYECMRPCILPDNPSERVMALPQTGKIQNKHKMVFGTGDTMEAPTLTSNVSFVRAAISKGMALAFIEHRPLALTRD